MAFLTGLAFCLLLIPVNRWLAVKIGKLSSEMMAQKDQRVKVSGCGWPATTGVYCASGMGIHADIMQCVCDSFNADHE